jgi:lipoprotein-anchoring transpeptidase ErfK/SrfK
MATKWMFASDPSAIYGDAIFSMKCCRFFSIFAVVLVALFSAGCIASKKKDAAAATAGPANRPSYWNGEGVTGPPKIVISIGAQRAYFYRGDKVVGETTISSGRTGFETPAGKYAVTQKDKDHVSNLYGEFIDEFSGEIVKSNVDISKENPPDGTLFQGSKMPFFMRFYHGYGLHAGRLPGGRASHGCIRLPGFMAEHFFNNCEPGTPVIVEE